MTPPTAPMAVVLGSTGFVGSAVTAALRAGGWTVAAVPAPRLTVSPPGLHDFGTEAETRGEIVEELRSAISGAQVVVNAAGDPDASSNDADRLMGANALLPLLVLRACNAAQIPRFVHVSSSVVQGGRSSLDSSTDMRPFSPYSNSKAEGERLLLNEPGGTTQLVIYRPPSVHAAGRGVTEKIRSLASGPARSVAGGGSQPTPQALLVNVADAVAFLATTELTPPLIVHHPWEGLSSAELLRLLGHREPRRVPTALARAAVAAVRSTERLLPQLAPNRRRVELLWFGQDVERSWLDDVGWMPPVGRAGWAALGDQPRD